MVVVVVCCLFGHFEHWQTSTTIKVGVCLQNWQHGPFYTFFKYNTNMSISLLWLKSNRLTLIWRSLNVKNNNLTDPGGRMKGACSKDLTTEVEVYQWVDRRELSGNKATKDKKWQEQQIFPAAFETGTLFDCRHVNHKATWAPCLISIQTKTKLGN